MAKKRDILTKVMWFKKREKFDLEYLYDVFKPVRTVSNEKPYKSGSYYSEKCKRVIQHESGLEEKFFKFLEKSPKVKFYYEQPIKIPFWHGRKRMHTTLDAFIYLKTREVVIVEVKPLEGMLDDKVQCKVEATMDFCSRHGFGFLMTDGKHTFSQIKKIKLNRKLEKEILKALDQSPIRWRKYKEIRDRCGSTHNELLRVILKHDLRYNYDFFKLRHGVTMPFFAKFLWKV